MSVTEVLGVKLYLNIKITILSTPFLEERDDAGIFFDFKWDKDLKKIIVKRDKDKYPIVRFSLFNKLDIEQGSIIKSVEGNDLSKLSDDKIKAIFLQNLNFGTI